MSLLGVGLRTRRKPQVASGPFRLPNQFCCEKNVIVTTDDLAERGQAGHACYPAFLLGSLNQSLSPYINRFLSADTIVLGYANPQNLNRYSYVNNNPLRYTNPTGHFCTEEDADGNIIHVNCGTGSPPTSGGGAGGENGSGGGGEDYCSTHPESCMLPPTVPPILRPPTVELPPGYPDFADLLDNYPSVTLHPSDLAFGPPILETVPVYSADGVVIGYVQIVNDPDLSLTQANWEADGTITDWQSIYVNSAVWMVSSMGICPECAPIVTTITIADLANQTIEIPANPRAGNMVPVHPGPYPDLPDIVNPFRFPPAE